MSQGSLVPGFLLAIVAGGLLGAVYDSFRVLRILLGGGRRWQVLFDMMTMAAAALLTFLVALAAEAGRLRFYLLAGEAMGFCLWALTFGELTLWAASLLEKLLAGISRLIRWIFAPFERFF